MTRDTSRRSVLVGSGAAVAGLLAVGSGVSANGHDAPVVIESVTPPEDLIVLRNEGDSDVDLSNYVIRWLYNNPDITQDDTLPESTVIEAGGELRITSGYYDTEADVTYDYDNGRINNDGTNTIALLTPDQQDEVSIYEGDGEGVENGAGGEPDDGDDGNGEPEEQEISGEAEVIGEEDTEHVDVTHDFPSQPIGEGACQLNVGVTNTSEDRELHIMDGASTFDADGNIIDTIDSGTIILEPGENSDAEFLVECEEGGSYEVTIDVMHSTEYDPDDGDDPADDPDDADDSDDDEPVEEDEDCPDDEDEDEAEADEDCPEDEPEPEPEDEDDC